MSTSSLSNAPVARSFSYEYGKIHYRETPSSFAQILNITHQETKPSALTRLFFTFVEMYLPQPLNSHPKRLWVDVSKITDFSHFKSLLPHKNNLEILKYCNIPETVLIPTVSSPVPTDYVDLSKPKMELELEEDDEGIVLVQSASTRVETIEVETKSASHARRADLSLRVESP